MSRFAGSTALAGTLLLAGCSAPAEAESVSAQAEVSTPAPDAGDCQPGGPGVEGLNVTTDTTAPPEITHTEALTPSTTERLVVVEGSGDEVKENDRVMVAYAYFNGATGEKIGHIGYDDVGPDMIPADPEAPYLIGLVHTLLCSQVGDRVAGVIPAEEAFGAAGAPEYGLDEGVSIIFIADVLGIQPPPEPPLERLVGDQGPTPAGFPDVTIEGTTVDYTLPEGDVPTTYAVGTVIDGEGTMVYDGAEVIVHYHGVNWNTGEVFDSSFDRGEPASFPTSGVIPGFRDGLVGQKVGSRVLITIPPALGYGPSGGTGDGRIGPEDTIFFVVDILGIR